MNERRGKQAPPTEQPPSTGEEAMKSLHLYSKEALFDIKIPYEVRDGKVIISEDDFEALISKVQVRGAQIER